MCCGSIGGLDGKSSPQDEFGKVTKENEKFVLHDTLMSKCLNFAGEQSAMEYLLFRLSEKAEDIKFRLLTSAKYHCELAGE